MSLQWASMFEQKMSVLSRDFNARRFFLFLTSLGKMLQEKSKVLTIRTFCAWFSWVLNIGMGWNRSIFVDERVGKLIIRESDRLIVLYIHCMISSVIRLFGLGVWFSLRVREVPGSNPGGAHRFCQLTLIKFNLSLHKCCPHQVALLCDT